jgi:hypothetical protein
LFQFSPNLVHAFREQLRKLVLNLSNIWRLPTDNAHLTLDESQDSVPPLPIEFLTQLSDHNDFAVVFSTAMQESSTDLFQPVSESSVIAESLNNNELEKRRAQQESIANFIQPISGTSVLPESQNNNEAKKPQATSQQGNDIGIMPKNTAVAFSTAMQESSKDLNQPVSETSGVALGLPNNNDVKKPETQSLQQGNDIGNPPANIAALGATEVEQKLVQKPAMKGKTKVETTNPSSEKVNINRRVKLSKGIVTAADSFAVLSEDVEDPFIGKAVAFRDNSETGRLLIEDFGKRWVPEAICYHLDGKQGHFVGTVVQRSRDIGKKQGKVINYDVICEFSSLGETNVPFTYMLCQTMKRKRMHQKAMMLCHLLMMMRKDMMSPTMISSGTYLVTLILTSTVLQQKRKI